MPFGEYKDFSDCKKKNQQANNPAAYCGYIKNQVEGGKRKEECLESPDHEAYHLEEAIRKTEALTYCPYHRKDMEVHTPEEMRQDAEPATRMEESPICPQCGGRNTSTYADNPNVATCRDCAGYVFNVSSDFDKMKPEETDRQTRMPKGTRHTLERMGGDEWTPEPELEKASAEFIRNLSATIDLVTLMAKESGYHDVSEKVSPTQPTYLYELPKDMADVVVKQSKGFGVEVNWFNTTLDKLQDIVKDANKFFIDSGWNSKETVKEYEAHKKKWGNDWM